MGIIYRTAEQLNQQLYPVSIHLKQTVSETITGDGTWQSPGTNIVLSTPTAENCSYVAGSINYDGVYNVSRYLYANVSIKAISAATTIILSGGKNDTPDTDYQPNVVLVNANDTKLLTIEIPVDLTGNNGDTVDFFIKADKDFTLVNANFRLGERKNSEL